MKTIALLVFAAATLHAADPAWLTTGEFHWKSTPPLITPAENAADPDVALKEDHPGSWCGRGGMMAEGRDEPEFVVSRVWRARGL